MNFVEKTPIGICVFDKDGNLLEKRFFSKNIKEAIDSFSLPDAESKQRFAAKQFRSIAKENFVSDEELNEFLCMFAIELSKNSMVGLIGKDKLLLHAINAYDEVEKHINIMEQRLSEWYSLHYPERKVSADLIVKYGRRDNMPGFSDSTGVDIDEHDETVLREYARTVDVMRTELTKLRAYIKDMAKGIMPNTSFVIDPMLASKMLAMAGSLEKFSRMTASTIQLMGAEKALFRHLKKEGKSPKYGIIFLDSRVQQATQDKKGKVARIVAAKIAQAVRIDFYSKRNDSERLEKELKEELDKI